MVIVALEGLGLLAILWVIAGSLAEDQIGNRPLGRRAVAFVGIIAFLAAAIWITKHVIIV